MDAVALRVGLHPRGRVDGVAEEAVPRVARADHVRHHWAGVEAHADVHAALARVVDVDDRSPRRLDGPAREERDALGMVGGLVLDQVRHGHVRVADGLHLEDVHAARQGVELRVQAVQHRRDLVRLHGPRDVREAHNVREENRHHAVVLRLDFLAVENGLRDVPREDVEEQVVGAPPPQLFAALALRGRGLQGLQPPGHLVEARPEARLALPAIPHQNGHLGAGRGWDGGSLLFFEPLRCDLSEYL
mmetsp:Transcript_73487/g.239085  ORF Transcript_73487/g.239085 Transcript_73487/m.239085 type:complete len:246 (-) Transcript_73487:2971-3708(-)